jgi:hypothetical protein
VQGREVGRCGGVGSGDGQLGVAIVQQGAAQDAGIDLEVGAAKAGLDGDFPDARGAEQRLGFGRLDQLSRRGRQAWRTGCGPQQQVRIKQQLQRGSPNSVSMAPAPILSKSTGTAICPARNPMRFGPPSGLSTGASFAIGLPAFAISTDSPAATRASRREKCVFAS